MSNTPMTMKCFIALRLEKSVSSIIIQLQDFVPGLAVSITVEPDGPGRDFIDTLIQHEGDKNTLKSLL
jgi:hypothetical protein